EFAFILPVYLLLIFGIIELGYVLWGVSALQYGASYGARYAFVHPTSSGSTIENFASSMVNFPTNALTYTVTMTPHVSADIDGTFTYQFLILPLNPLTITTHVHQVLPS
ncbi:MAG TPA: TadE family protein, partial [Alphaproteobacteria bacterium]|nr:TadE family protein [Alphaproteobacteria bacterium]